MVSRSEGLIYRRRTCPFTAISIVTFGIDDPLAPVELLKVHPHVHLPAEVLQGVFVSLSSTAPHPGGGHRSLSVQTEVLGLLCCADQGWDSLAAWTLPGEDHHHHPVGCRVLDSLLLVFLLHLSYILLHPLICRSPMKPETEHFCHVEHFPC